MSPLYWLSRARSLCETPEGSCELENVIWASFSAEKKIEWSLSINFFWTVLLKPSKWKESDLTQRENENKRDEGRCHLWLEKKPSGAFGGPPNDESNDNTGHSQQHKQDANLLPRALLKGGGGREVVDKDHRETEREFWPKDGDVVTLAHRVTQGELDHHFVSLFTNTNLCPCVAAGSH